MILYAVLLFVFSALLILAGVLTCRGGYDLIYDYAINGVNDLKGYTRSNPFALIGLGVLVVGIVVAYIFFHRIQTKYNGGMF